MHAGWSDVAGIEAGFISVRVVPMGVVSEKDFWFIVGSCACDTHDIASRRDVRRGLAVDIGLEIRPSFFRRVRVSMSMAKGACLRNRKAWRSWHSSGRAGVDPATDPCVGCGPSHRGPLSDCIAFDHACVTGVGFILA